MKRHKGAIFCVLRDCPTINDPHTAMADWTHQSLESGIDKHPSPWSRERATVTCTLQLLLRTDHYLVMEVEEITVTTATLETCWVTWHQGMFLSLWKIHPIIHPTTTRSWLHKLGIGLKTSGFFAWLWGGGFIRQRAGVLGCLFRKRPIHLVSQNH